MPDARLPRVLVIDDDPTFRKLLASSIAEEQFEVDTATNGINALERMGRRAYDLALVDLCMPEMEGLPLLEEMCRRHPGVTAIVLTGYGSVESAVAAMRSGAFTMLSKSSSVDEIVQMLRSAFAERRRLRAGTGLEDAIERREAFMGIVGCSPSMLDVFATVERLWGNSHPVLVCGESGTGKELVARALHAGSPRASGPFIAVNCALLKENFVESELFGHVRGAFTGAVAARDGLFQLANRGMLLIDEIGEMPESSQAALLRVLETQSYRPLGAMRETRVDVRVVAATNRDLDRAVAEKRFRADLFYRLCVGRIDLPPLRERPACLPLLVSHFFDSSETARQKQAKISHAAMATISKHHWPGNVRELFNCLERALMTSEDGIIEPRHLTFHAVPAPAVELTPLTDNEAPDLTLADFERGYIERLLTREGGNVSTVARILEVDPTTLRRKIRRWREI